MKSRSFVDRVRSLSPEQKVYLTGRLAAILDVMDDRPDPLYECRLEYGSRKDCWSRWVSSVELVGDDIVIHTSAEACGVDESLANLAGALFRIVDKPSRRFCVYQTEFDPEVQHEG